MSERKDPLHRLSAQEQQLIAQGLQDLLKVKQMAKEYAVHSGSRKADEDFGVPCIQDMLARLNASSLSLPLAD